MGSEKRQRALTYLCEQAEKQGYVTFDNIMDCADANSLPIQDFDWLTSAITTRGILVYDEIPASRTDFDDDYAQSDYEAVFDRIIELDESLKSFITEVRNILPPQWKEFSQLKYQVVEGNQHARNRVIEMHLRIAVKIALQRAETYDMDIQDAIGEACVGLVLAVDKYNPDTNGPFGSYASMWILQTLSRQQPTRRPLMYYPVHKKEQFFSSYLILKENGYAEDPDILTNKEAWQLIQEKLFLDNEQTEDVLMAMTPFESYNEKYSMFLENRDVFEKQEYEWEANNRIPYELIYDAEIDQYIEAFFLREYIKEALGTLTEREKDVLEMRYGFKDGQEWTLEEIGVECHVTRERIRQIEAKALRKLRHPSRSKKLRDFVDLLPEEFIKD